MKRHHITKTLLVIITLAITAFAACSDDKDETYSLQVDKSNIKEISPKGMSGTFDILSNTNWTITDIPDWISLSKTSGTDNARISFAVAPYATTSQDVRTATLTIKSPDVAEVRQVTFSQYSSSTYYMTTDAKKSYVVPYTGETISFNIKSNTSWEIKNIPYWISLSNTEGEGDKEITVNIEKMLEKLIEERQGTFVMVNKQGKLDSITIIQTPKEYPYLRATYIQVGYDKKNFEDLEDIHPNGCTFYISIDSNIDWTCSIDKTWATVSQREASFGLSVAYLSEEFPFEREAILTVAPSKQGVYHDSLTLKIPVKQIKKHPNILDKIKDENIKSVIIKNLNLKNPYLTEEEGKDITQLGLTNITSIEGIEYLRNLSHLHIYKSNLPSFDLKEVANLKFLSFDECNTSTIEINGTPLLEEISYVSCSSTSLSVICESVKSIYLAGNNLNEIDVSTADSQFAKLYFASNTSGNLSLKGNSISHITGSRISAQNVDISLCPNLVEFSCENGQISSISIDNPNLESMNCSSNKLTSLDISKAPNLTQLECSGNYISNITMNNPNLSVINCSNNQLTKLDISKSTKLRTLLATDNPLNTLYVWWSGGQDNIPSGFYSFDIPDGVSFIKK